VTFSCCFFFFPFCYCFCVGLSFGFSFFLLLLYLLCDHCGLSWVLGSGSLGSFLLVFLVLGKVGVFLSFVVISGLGCIYLF